MTLKLKFLLNFLYLKQKWTYSCHVEVLNGLDLWTSSIMNHAGRSDGNQRCHKESQHVQWKLWNRTKIKSAMPDALAIVSSRALTGCDAVISLYSPGGRGHDHQPIFEGLFHWLLRVLDEASDAFDDEHKLLSDGTWSWISLYHTLM